MEHAVDLKDWTNPDLSLPDESTVEPTKTCLGCGAPVNAGETPACGH